MPECPECGYRTRSAYDYCPFDGAELIREDGMTAGEMRLEIRSMAGIDAQDTSSFNSNELEEIYSSLKEAN